MARLGTFDPQLEPKAWFDENALAEGWFVADLIPSATGAYTLVADGATYTYSGNNANLLVNRSLIAEGGSYTYSGNNADLVYSGGPPPPPVVTDIYFIELRSFTERRRM